MTMQSIHEAILAPKEQIIQQYRCKSCKQSVTQKEMIIPVGPYKGDTVVVDAGCKCEEIELIKKVRQQNHRHTLSKLTRLFDSHSFMNASLQQATFENYEPTNMNLEEAKNNVLDFTENFDPITTTNLLLVGDYGVGKSHLSAAVTKQLIKKGYSCLFVSVPKLLTKIKQSYNELSHFKESELLAFIEKVDLFVLDDLGTEYTRPGGDSWTHAKLFEILDSRAGKPTIFTTNLTGEQLRKKVNTRNLSRIMNETQVVQMKGPDYRMRGLG